MSKILVISPKYPPLIDGLAGHTFHFINELAKNNDMTLLTDSALVVDKSQHVKIISSVNKWNFLKVRKAFLELPTEYDQIIIQYVPSLYASRGGINFSIVFFFIYLRFIIIKNKKTKINVIFHELFYPLQFHWKAIVLHLCHKSMLLFTVISSHRGFCSTSYFTNLLKKIPFTKNKIIHLPVGPTVEIPKELKVRNVNDVLKFTIFGGYHPSKRYDIIFNVLERLFNEKVKFELTIIGTTKEKLTNDIELPKNFSQWANAIGKQDDKNVVSIFEESDFLISYFSDGMSTRRSSAISALALGLPVISSKTERTDSVLLSNSDSILFDVANFETSLYSFIKSSPKAPIRSSLYKNHLNWTQIVRKFTHNLLV